MPYTKLKLFLFPLQWNMVHLSTFSIIEIRTKSAHTKFTQPDKTVGVDIRGGGVSIIFGRAEPLAK